EARLGPRAALALVFDIGVSLQHGGVPDAQLHAHLAHRGHPLPGPIDAAADILRELLGNALIEQQIGHLAESPQLNRNSSTGIEGATGTVTDYVGNTVGLGSAGRA